MPANEQINAVPVNQVVVEGALLKATEAASPAEIASAVTKTTRAKPKEGFPADILAIFKRPLPLEAIKDAPRGLSSIKSIYVTERLNEAFGEGRWNTKAEIIERGPKEASLIVLKVTLNLLDYPWFYAEAFGGNTNADLGDSYKGAVTDAISKIAAVQFGIGADVFKGKGKETSAEFEKAEKVAAAQAAKDPKAAKAAVVAAEVKTAQATVAVPPNCDDCLARNPDKPAPIKSYSVEVPDKQNPGKTKTKVYDAADLTKESQKKYQLNLCAQCQGARTKALKEQTARVQ